MKRTLLGILIVFFILTIFLIITIIIISFKIVKQTTDSINFALKKDFQKVVRIPDVIPPETKGFNKTVYIWEMVTNEEEITKVKFTHDTAFIKSSEKINATLEMPPGSDPSIFFKVLPAVVADPQTIISITDEKRLNLAANSDAGYSSIQLFADEKSQKIVKVVWEFDKTAFVDKNSNLYNKIYNYPEPLLHILYKIQRGILLIFST